MQQRPRLPGKEGAEGEAREVDQDLPDEVGARRQQPDDRLDRHMAAQRLHRRRRHEYGADDQEDGELVLPVRGDLQEIADDDAVGEDEARGDQRDRRRCHHQVVDESEDAISGACGCRRLSGLDVVEAVSHRRASPTSGLLHVFGELEQVSRERRLLGVVLPRGIACDGAPLVDGLSLIHI